MGAEPTIRVEVARGPLAEGDAALILTDYNRLTQSDVPLSNFKRWTQQSPSGPASHGLLRNADGQIVGHCCLMPFPMRYRGVARTAAKIEYFYVLEGYRKAIVAGFEKSPKPPALILLTELYRNGAGVLQWSPLIASAPKLVAQLHRMAGCRPINFALNECLLIEKPLGAARFTPNQNWKRRLGLFAVGSLQSLFSIGRLFRRTGTVSTDHFGAEAVARQPLSVSDKLSLQTDLAFLKWRYPASNYFHLSDSHGGYVIAKKGSTANYLRVCQSRFRAPDESLPTSISILLKEARSEGAMGLRWAAYEQGDAPASLPAQLKKEGFFCARREREILIYGGEKELLDPAQWVMDDFFVSFDA